MRGLGKDAVAGAVDCCSCILPASTRILLQNLFVLLFNLGRKIRVREKFGRTLWLAATESRMGAVEESEEEPSNVRGAGCDVAEETSKVPAGLVRVVEVLDLGLVAVFCNVLVPLRACLSLTHEQGIL